MLQLADDLTLDDNDLSFETYLAAGPGGQNVNKVATAVRLRFALRTSAALTDEVKARLEKLAGSRMTTEGVLVLEARRYRTQEANRQDALRRLAGLLRLDPGQPVKAPAGMGLDIGKRLVLPGHVVKHPGQKRVLLDIGQIPGMEGVLIGKHARC